MEDQKTTAFIFVPGSSWFLIHSVEVGSNELVDRESVGSTTFPHICCHFTFVYIPVKIFCNSNHPSSSDDQT